jgi:hypothetical protein
MKKRFLPTVAVLLAFTGIAGAAASYQTISTELNEVRAGNFGGVDYLDLYIDRHIGPVTCRNNIVSIDVNRYVDKTNANIEVIAVSALVQSEQVLITVPLEKDNCVDGKPLVSDLTLIPHNPLF